MSCSRMLFSAASQELEGFRTQGGDFTEGAALGGLVEFGGERFGEGGFVGEEVEAFEAGMFDAGGLGREALDEGGDAFRAFAGGGFVFLGIPQGGEHALEAEALAGVRQGCQPGRHGVLDGAAEAGVVAAGAEVFAGAGHEQAGGLGVPVVRRPLEDPADRGRHG